jgi:hypothetical protein
MIDHYPFQIDFTYDQRWCKRIGKVFEVEIAPPQEAHTPDSWRLVEVNEEGEVVDEAVPFQFDAANQITITSGTLSVYLAGESIGNQRNFRLLMGGEGQAVAPLVTLQSDDQPWEGQPAWVIGTLVAKYYYHPTCGGYASLIDRDGNDWISYHPHGGSDGEYRGIPNVIFTALGGTFHPGREGCESKIVSQGPLKLTIETVTEKFGFACRWEIFPEYARLTILGNALPYWFLYEGTPGGKFEPEEDFVVLPNGEIRPASQQWHDYGVPWIMFGDGKSKRGLFIIRHADLPETEDSYWPMEGNMTVWGFGRVRKSLPLGALHDFSPLQFTLGLVENADSTAAVDKVRSCQHEEVIFVSDVMKKEEN